MIKVTLVNNFHGTEASVMMEEGTTPHEAWETLQALANQEFGYGKEKRRLRRVEKELCPSYPDCACGGYRP